MRWRLAVFAMGLLCIVGSASTWSQGRPTAKPKTGIEPVPLARILSEPNAFKKGPVRVRGVMVEPSDRNGWYFLSDGQQRIRILFADYTSPPPQGVDGDRVIVEGFVQTKTLTRRDVRTQPKDMTPLPVGHKLPVLITYYVERL